MTTKKGNDSDDEYGFDPLEALADVVTGDAFTFFDEPVKAVEKATNDTGAKSGAGEASGGSGGKAVEPEPKPTVKPLPPPTKKGEAAGEQKQAEGGNADGGDKK